jgi:3-oxoacyl-[acyl-carrier-protein] synthase-3
VSNAALIAEKGLESTPEWIESRTGIRQRFLCGEGETTATLATAAARQVLERAGVDAAEVGVVLVATCTPDKTFPATAALVQGALGVGTGAAVMDVNAACSGFIHALAVARGLMETLAARHALVIGADTFGNLVDWQDRGTCVLFGDGAGAVVLERGQGTGAGVLGIELGADGRQAGLLISSGGTATTRDAGVVLMNGREVFKHAVRQMGALPALLAEHGVAAGDLDWLVPHQANARIIEAAAAALEIPLSKVVMTVGDHANTSAASIPLALDAAARDGRLRAGNLVLLQAFGAGFSWSTALLRW